MSSAAVVICSLRLKKCLFSGKKNTENTKLVFLEKKKKYFFFFFFFFKT